jgi:hypothetical protein
VTCYFRHLEATFDKAGIKVTSQNRKDVDSVIRSIIGSNYTDCPAVWRQVKKCLADDEKGFVAKLKIAWENRKLIQG